MEVVIIGTGNAATILGRKIKQAGHRIVQVYGRTAKGEALAAELGAVFCSSWKSIALTADLYLAAIADNALYELPEDLRLKDKLIVHTAGSVSKEVLNKVSSRYGVLYPLQSLRKELSSDITIPLLVDASDAASLDILSAFANSISAKVSKAGDEERKKLHVAAVITSNFTNHLYAFAEDYCRKEQLDFTLLHPLINETASRISQLSPARLQTGPAARKDDSTINEHLSLLEHYPGLHHLYALLTRSIKENDNFAASKREDVHDHV